MSARRGRPAPLPESGFLGKLWSDCWFNLAGLLGANMLLLLWCTPVILCLLLQFRGLALALFPITIGPAVLGLFGYVANLAMERPASFWRDSLRGFGPGFGAGALVSCVAMLAAITHDRALGAALAAGMPTGPLVVWAAQLALLTVLALAGIHVLSLIGLYRQGVREAFRNALLLALAHPGPTVGLLAAWILAGLAARALSWGPLVILPALVALLAVNTTLMLVRRHPRTA